MKALTRATALLALLAACSAPTDFARIDADLRAAGKLRADRNPADAPFDPADLARNFERIAFGSEFAIRGGRYAALGASPDAPLTRWARPVRYALRGQATGRDARHIAGFTRRLARATGVEFRLSARRSNMLVFFLDAPGRAALGRELAARPDYRPLRDLFEAWAGDPAWPCAAEFYYHPAGSPRAHEVYFAVIYIRDEVRGLSRRSCIEEEIAQSMGLARDDPAARPSIFNDDEEFALMTAHDAALLELLYDSRLEPGMTPAEAMPRVRRILNLADEALSLRRPSPEPRDRSGNAPSRTGSRR